MLYLKTNLIEILALSILYLKLLLFEHFVLEIFFVKIKYYLKKFVFKFKYLVPNIYIWNYFQSILSTSADYIIINWQKKNQK